MKKVHLIWGVFALMMTFTLSSCLNEDNKIPPNCYDGILNNDEEAIDCGGSCDPCDPCENGIWNPELGETWVDCGGDCGPCPTSANGCQDGDETGVDCGGSTGIDCLSLCDDGLPNGWEDNAAVDCLTPPGFPPDCGGPCEPCPTCDDGVMNQAEIGIDCGGSGCPSCATDGNCLNGYVDGNEVYIDCAYEEDNAGFCPQCEVNIIVGIDGVAHEFNGFMTAADMGGTMVISGQNILNDQIVIAFNEPDGGWPVFYAGGLPNMAANNTTFNASITLNEFASGIAFSTSFDADGGTIAVSYIDTDVPGFVAGSFNGDLSNDVGTASRTMTNGSIRVFVE